MECKFCNKKFNQKKQLWHVKNKCNLTQNKFYLFFSSIYNKDIIDKIINLYIEGYSLDQLNKTYNISRNAIQAILRQKNIHIRNILQSKNSIITKNKYKNSCLIKYGVENASQNCEIKEKKAKTFLQHYGVDNVRKCKDFRQKHGFNDTMLKKYGKLSIPNRYGNKNKWWATISKNDRRKMLENLQKASLDKWKNLTQNQKIIIIQKRRETLYKNYPNGIPKGSSKLEYRIKDICEKNNISFKHQFFINRHSYDFKFNKNIILEVQGDFWHANPKIYQENDILCFGKDKKTAKQIWEKDKNNKLLAEKYGYIVFYLWEKEINTMSDNQILIFLQNIIRRKK